MRKRNYPKNRKPRNTSYAKSTQLINKYGKEKLKEVFSRVGMYLAAKELETSPYVVRYVRRYKLNNQENNNDKSRSNHEEVHEGSYQLGYSVQ